MGRKSQYLKKKQMDMYTKHYFGFWGTNNTFDGLGGHTIAYAIKQ